MIRKQRNSPQWRAAKAILDSEKRAGRSVPNGSWQTALVVDWLMSKNELYGLDLIKHSELTAGTLYPILSRLDDAQWVTSERRPSSRPNTPDRIYYSLNEYGRNIAGLYLVVHGHKLKTVPPRRRPIIVLPAPTTPVGGFS